MRKIPFSKVSCEGNELSYIKEVLESGWLTTASKTKKLEERFAQAVGVRFSCAVNSCTAALHLALEALGVKPKDKVFVPTMTFTATAMAVRYLDAEPVFLDVEYGTSLITPSILETAIKNYPEAKVLLLVHFGGQAAEMKSGAQRGILDICKAHGIKLVEDAAHAFPSRYHGQTVGTFGDVTCFSFYANKTITTGEGGMFVTNNEQLASRARIMRMHGIDRSIWKRFTSNKPSWKYDIVAPGFKYNMPDINAAIGLAQLERADEFRAERERCARFYMQELEDLACIDLPRLHVDMEDHAWHLFPIILKETARVDRDDFIERLAECGVGTSVHYRPLHRMTYYQKRYNIDPSRFPDAERIWKGCVSLPIYTSLSSDELGYICTSIKKILA